ncbi:MAG: META domain-containing protein [Spirochaetaceae bacterium]|jgi:heat shock protein HslJ|nr:META domain-containing protein [Spirochaetaceae bacterium]
MKSGLHVLLCAAVAVVICGCASSGKTVPSESAADAQEAVMLEPGKNWMLVSLDTDAGMTAVAEGNYITMTTAEGAVSGNAGINTFRGPVQTSGGNLAFGPLAMTEMMGIDPAKNALETQFISLLDRSVKATESAEELVLSDSNGKALLVFKPYTLMGISWKLLSYNSGSAVVSVTENKGDRALLLFLDEGKLSGSTGVNNVMGTYTEGASAALELSPLAMTRMAALNEDAAQFEKTYTELLARTASYRLSKDALTLVDAEGAVLLIFAIG